MTSGNGQLWTKGTGSEMGDSVKKFKAMANGYIKLKRLTTIWKGKLQIRAGKL